MLMELKPRPPTNKSNLQCFWLHGASNASKNEMVRQIAEEFNLPYYKFLNDTEFTYWEDYKNQPIVELAELSPDRKPQAGILKDAADRYPFLARRMYGSIYIRPLSIFITSNYHMDDLYDRKDLEALRNRFFEIGFSCSYNDLSAEGRE